MRRGDVTNSPPPTPPLPVPLSCDGRCCCVQAQPPRPAPLLPLPPPLLLLPSPAPPPGATQLQSELGLLQFHPSLFFSLKWGQKGPLGGVQHSYVLDKMNHKNGISAAEGRHCSVSSCSCHESRTGCPICEVLGLFLLFCLPFGFFALLLCIPA